MHSLSYAFSLLALPAAFNLLANAQCANNVAVYHYDMRTMTSNSTWFIIPVKAAAVESAVKLALPLGNATLLPIPVNDKTLFPHGWPAGMHPVIASIGYDDDIRMGPQQIDGPLIGSSIYAPFVSQNGKNGPLQVSLNGYIAGPTGPLPNGLVPAEASSLLFSGVPLRLGQFVPEAAAYEEAEGIITTQAKWAVQPNPISGPGVYIEAVDLEFTTLSTPYFPASTFHYLINQPTLLPDEQCQRNTYYFNNASAHPVFRHGQVTLGPGASGYGLESGVLEKAAPGGVGVFKSVYGYSGCAQGVGYTRESCADAVAAQPPQP